MTRAGKSVPVTPRYAAPPKALASSHASLPADRATLAWVALSPIFLSGLSINTSYGIFQLSYIVMAVAYLLMVRINRVTGVTRPLVLLVSLAFMFSAAGIALTLDEAGDGWARLVPVTAKLLLVCFFLVFYYSAFLLTGGTVRALFEQYLRVSVFFGSLGLIQAGVFVIAGLDFLKPLADGSKTYGAFLGIAALSVEPAFYAVSLLPAGAYYLASIMRGDRITWRSGAVLLAILASTSALGYLGLAVALAVTVLVGIRRANILRFIVVIPFIGFGAWWLFSQPFIQLRWQDTVEWLTLGLSGTNRSSLNISTYALAVNSSMAFDALSGNPFGWGFGAYSAVYDRFIVYYDVPDWRDSLPGRGSATSLFLRLTAEIGFVAWAIQFWFVYQLSRAVIKGNDPNIATGYLATLAVILIRMGEYYANGVLFVFFMSFMIWREARDVTAEPGQPASNQSVLLPRNTGISAASGRR